MGYWGSDIFENDEAGDYLDGEIVTKVIKTIVFGLAQDMHIEDWRYEPTSVLAAVDLFALLCRHYDLTPDTYSISERLVRQWHSTYLKLLEAHPSVPERGSRAEYIEQQHKLAAECFGKLLRIIEENPPDDPWGTGISEEHRP